MIHKHPSPSGIPAEYQTNYSQLLVSGCSFTSNCFSQTVTWPWYTKDICQFTTVFDAAQTGAGNTHVFNSIVNEIETNQKINTDELLVVLMLSGFARLDTVAESKLSQAYHFLDCYNFTEEYSTMSILNMDFSQPDTKLAKNIGQIRELWDQSIGLTARIFENVLKVIALDGYLQSKNIECIITTWMPPDELKYVPEALQNKVLNRIAPIKTLYEYTTDTNQRLSDLYKQGHPHGRKDDHHPHTEAHLEWCRLHLWPYLEQQKYITKII